MRMLLMAFAVLGLGACTEQPGLVQQGFNPNAGIPVKNPSIAPVGNPSVAAVPGPPGDLPTGQGHRVCVTAVNLC
jgi:hypothetical protein